MLYGLGWISVRPLEPLGLTAEHLALIGTLISFLLFVLLLPRWTRLRWGARNGWRVLGLSGGGQRGRPTLLVAWLRGTGLAAGLLMLVVIPVLAGSWGHWLGEWSLDRCLNALLLAFGVGLAEELIFRAWLWEELNQLLGATGGVLAQAACFSLVHTRFQLGIWPTLGLLSGLFVLGLVLAVQRQLDGGSLWGSIGLHGGLVGGWFLLQSSLLQISPDAPAWLVGPGGLNPTPLGGLVAAASLAVVLNRQVTAVAKAARPETGARRES